MEESKIERFPVVIDDAKPADAQTIADIRYQNLLLQTEQGIIEAAAREDTEEIAETIEHSNEDSFYLVAKHEGSVVGTCQVIWRPQEERFQLRRFYLQPDLRNKKIGSELFSAVKGRTQISPHLPKGLFLNVEEKNVDAQRAYERWGLKPTTRDEEKKRIRMELNF